MIGVEAGRYMGDNRVNELGRGVAESGDRGAGRFIGD